MRTDSAPCHLDRSTSRPSTLGIWDMLTFDKSPMKLRDIVAKPLHWDLRDHAVIPDLKLNLSVRNLERQ